LDNAEFRRGRRVAIDWGKARIGVAACDPDGILAFPVETVQNSPKALDRIAEIVAEYEPLEVLLGMPKDLEGRVGVAGTAMLDVAKALDNRLAVPLRLVDERLSTRVAAHALHSAGRSAKKQRVVIDQAAAVAILESALDYERQTGQAPGIPFSQQPGQSGG
jgi:putative Holliday junction resolvase